jgi:hypothetical protein
MIGLFRRTVDLISLATRSLIFSVGLTLLGQGAIVYAKSSGRRES